MASEQPRAFVVEREPTVAALLTEILDGEGYRVAVLDPRGWALDADEAREAQLVVADFPPDRATREESRRIIGELRAAVAPRRLPVVGLTADYQLLQRAASRFADMPDFAILAKPFGLDALLDVAATLRAVAREESSIASHSPETAILITDPDGRYVDANAHALSLLGYSLGELRQLRVSDVMVATPRATREQWSRYRREGTWSGEAVRLRRRDGREVEVKVHASVLHRNRGEPPRYIAWLRS